MKLTPQQFTTKWGTAQGRFGPNDEFRITALDLMDFAQDALDTFGGAAGGYTDQQARAAQLNRVPAPGTTTVLLTAEAATDYGTAASGSFQVNAAGCVVGKEAYFALGAGAQAPAFSGAPSGRPFKLRGASYATGKAFSYSLRVCPDCIEVIVLPD